MKRKKLRELMKGRLPKNFSGYVYDDNPPIVVEYANEHFLDITNVYWDNTNHRLVIQLERKHKHE